MARRGNGSNFWSKFGAFPKSNRDTLDVYYFLIIFYVWDTSLMCGILVDDDDDDDRHTLDPTPLLALRTQDKNTA